MGRIKTVWEPCVFQTGPSVPFQRVANGYIWFFTETGAKSVAMATTQRCHSVSFVMYISGAQFEEHWSNISRDILDSDQCFTDRLERFMTSSLSSFA